MGEEKEQRRRTQRERRESTTEAILASAIASIDEVGLAASSVQAISDRAGVSQSAVFRYFPTRKHLMVAVAERCAGAITSEFGAYVIGRTVDVDSVLVTLAMIRESVSGRNNRVWLELLSAARSDEVGSALMRPVVEQHNAELGHLVEEFAGDDVDRLGVLLGLRIALLYFRGEAQVAHLVANRDLDERALLALADLTVELAGGRHPEVTRPAGT